MPIEVTVVTSNRGKFVEIQEMLQSRGWTVHWSRRTLPEPQADTLEEVVHAKLDAVGPARGWVLVEDSGFFVGALNGFPGVYSAYALRTLGLRPLLRWVRGRRRDAVFRTVAGIRHGNLRWTARGEVAGSVASSPRGRHGFGFDPIFIPQGGRRTYGQLTSAEKGRTSHRSRAILALARQIEKGGAPAPRAPARNRRTARPRK
ncbi:MAG: non-canonical purine NTP pyrophosphatase [Thermoplasmata archaeon]|nr:non-canonical purine NTP pyrophosphatase [Thermoplasmata archaeon]